MGGERVPLEEGGDDEYSMTNDWACDCEGEREREKEYYNSY